MLAGLNTNQPIEKSFQTSDQRRAVHRLQVLNQGILEGLLLGWLLGQQQLTKDLTAKQIPQRHFEAGVGPEQILELIEQPPKIEGVGLLLGQQRTRLIAQFKISQRQAPSPSSLESL
ncbi:MAG: hypothetical protein FJ060_07085 [Cyanobacteria bacterium K_Offshore_0m_m2_072]|nr:hypothetical protein [Cyanobacteria bacterium K_Offshore_0m_m2_072]